MATAITGIFNHAMTAAQAATGAAATSLASPAADAAGTSSNRSSSDTSSATISANDFLTLLVTEMKNQDPTANTDPNQYINQLVNVNSLQQLISINQTLSESLGSPVTSSGSPGIPQAAAKTSALASPGTGGPLPAGQFAASKADLSSNLGDFVAAAKRSHGNLSVPDANPAAHNVAQAFSGRSHGHPIARGLASVK